MSDRAALTVTGFARAMTTGLFGVLAGSYLAQLGLSARAVFFVIAAGLAGGACAAALATLFADRVGRRRFLLGVAALSVGGSAAFALSSQTWALAVTAFVGMLSGMGRDRGAALVLEQAALPATATDSDRTRVIAVYTMLQDLGHAGGALLAGVPALASGRVGLPAILPQRAALLGCAVVGLVAVVLYARLGPGVEAGASVGQGPSLATRRILTRISALFALDGLGGGFLTTAAMAYFFRERFGAHEGLVALLFFAARLVNAASHLGAAWLARRIGLVRTMVFTHVPSSFLLVTVAFAPSFGVAALLFLLREGLVEMDVPARQSYVLAVVAPEERTLASGVTNLVRLAAWAVAPALAALAAPTGSLALPIVVGATMKLAYDGLLYAAFEGIRPPEERAALKSGSRP